MGTGVGLAEYLYLALEESVFLARTHTVGHGLVHLVSSVNDHLYVLLLQVFLGELGYLLVGNQLASGKYRLCKRTDSREQELTRIDNHTACRVGPSCRTAEVDAGIESGTGCCSVVESLLHSVVGHTDVGTVLQHLGGNANLQVFGVEHTFIFITHGLGMM